MRVALVHDWLTGKRGGEYVLEAIAELYPAAELFTLLHLPGAVDGVLAKMPCHTSLLQRVPAADRYYRHFLPVMPRLIEAFDLSEYDLIVSSSHCVAKGIRRPPGSAHVSYVHAPMRYIWDRYDDYFGPKRAALPVRVAAAAVRRTLQAWDRRVSASDRVDLLIANSHFIAEQIERAYGRSAQVIHPFVDTTRFNRARRPTGSYLMVGAFAPNKRVDLAIAAFNRLQLPLCIVGKGQEEERLRRMAGPSIEFLGALPNAEIEELYASSRAFVFPGIEDFGITPLEAMASGLPVIAFGAAGVLETVVDGETGIFFRSQTVESLMEAVLRVERGEVEFDESKLRARAAQFSKATFQARFLTTVDETLRRLGLRSHDTHATPAERPRYTASPAPRTIGVTADGAI